MTYTRDEWDALICTQGDDDAAMIRQLLAESEWQPIETAPRDETAFLALEQTRHFDCWWHTDDQGMGWWMDDADTEPTPTHWRPLHAPPKQG
jgi:hypothetical protein